MGSRPMDGITSGVTTSCHWLMMNCCLWPLSSLDLGETWFDWWSSCFLNKSMDHHQFESEDFVVNYTSYDDRVTWNAVKSRCEDLGQRLAVEDTAYKLTALREQVWVKNINVYCNNETLFNNKDLCQNIVIVWFCFSSLTNLGWHWIGFHDLNNNNKFYWFNGNPLSDDGANWISSKHGVWFLHPVAKVATHITQHIKPEECPGEQVYLIFDILFAISRTS